MCHSVCDQCTCPCVVRSLFILLATRERVDSAAVIEREGARSPHSGRLSCNNVHNVML
jgi:hypothetical protein